MRVVVGEVMGIVEAMWNAELWVGEGNEKSVGKT